MLSREVGADADYDDREAEWSDADALDQTVLRSPDPRAESPMTARDGGGWNLLGRVNPASPVVGEG